jgi:hypothetical protein
MDDLPKATILDQLAREYQIRILNSGAWERIHLQRVHKAVTDLAKLMGASASFQREIGGVRISRSSRQTRLAAVTLPVIHVVYFESASWGDISELKWQTVHELAHVWDMRKLLRLSSGLKRAAGGKYAFARRFPVPREYHPGETWLTGRSAPLNALEDWADSVATYVYPDHAESIPESLGGPKLISLIRWNYVGKHMQVKLPYPIGWASRF